MTDSDDPWNKVALIPLAEAARRLSMSTKTLRGLVQDGLLPFVNIGRGQKNKRLAFDPVDIEEFVRRHKRFEAPKCLPDKTRARRSAASVTGSIYPDLREILAQRKAATQKK